MNNDLTRDFICTMTLCFIMPPVAVIDKSNWVIFLVMLLTFLGWAPGVIAAIIISKVWLR